MKTCPPITDPMEWEVLLFRTRLHKIIDARAAEAMRVIRAMAERDRCSIGQLTGFDHIKKRRLP